METPTTQAHAPTALHAPPDLPPSVEADPARPVLALVVGILLLAGAARLLWPSGEPSTPPATADTLPPAPRARRIVHLDEYHGVTVADPYRWMEDLDAPEVAAWVDAQNARTRAFLDAIPERAQFEARITELWNYEKRSVPDRRGERLFFTRNTGLQPQGVLHVQEGLHAEPCVLIDPNTLSADGTVALHGSWPTSDGALLAYSVSEAGSDWQTWRVKNVATGKDLPDRLDWIKFSGCAWTPDNDGFYYSRYDEPPPGKALAARAEFQKLYYHRIGTPQTQDTLVYARADHAEWGFDPTVTEDGRWLVVHVWAGSGPKNLVYVRERAATTAPFTPLIGEFESSYWLIGNDDTRFYFLTDRDAPRRRVIAIDVRSPAPAQWRTIVPQRAETLEGMSLFGNRLVGQYLKDAHAEVLVFGLDGQAAGTVRLPGLGSVSGFGGLRDARDTFFSFTSFTTPTTIYRMDLAGTGTERYWAPTIDLDPDAFDVAQVFYRSKDGTRIPMFLVHRTGLARDGQNPVWLYGYGGFNNALTPWFVGSGLVWLERGGVIAIANIRGGGEYGREWHEAGTKLKKQNVFDDFIAAAEWLCAEKITRPGKLAIAGGSNGGLLVGACMTQRPDLFGACLPAVGVLDMLRYESFTIGWAWASDYGSVKNADEFKALLAYSPYQNVKMGTRYPPTLVTTADHDDRVWPAHSFKFAAALQHAHRGDAPILIRVETRAGHGAGKPTAKRIAELADQWAFLTAVLK